MGSYSSASPEHPGIPPLPSRAQPRRAGHGLSGHRRLARFCSGAAVLLTTLLLISAPGRQEPAAPGIWMFDFRDTFYDVEFLEGRKAVIVGDRGRILVSHEKYPNLWAPHDHSSREMLTCVDFVDARHGWAAGHGGIIIHSADGGRSWGVQRSPATRQPPLFDIQFLSVRVGYACGASDSFLKTEDGGVTWTEMPAGEEVSFNGLGFLDYDRGYLVGEFGTVLCTSDGGASWQRLDLAGYQGSLFGVAPLPARTLLVFGIAGRIMRSEDGGSSWERLSSGTRSSLFRAAVNGDDLAVVGASGAMLWSRDGGRSFRLLVDKEFTTLAGVSAHPDGGFLCVGERGSVQRFSLPGAGRQ